MVLNPLWADNVITAQVDAVKVLLNTGYIRIYDGSRPAGPNTAVGAVNLLAELRYGATAFGASALSGSEGSRVATATANAISDVNASYTSTATWFRALKSDGTTAVCDGNVGTSGCDLNLTDVTLTSGETVHVTSHTISAPE